MQYLTYDEYIGIGGTLDLPAFSRQIDRVSAFVRGYTFGRIDKMAVVPAAVKACCRDLVELYGQAKANNGVTSRSQSAGGVSESESYAAPTADDIELEAYFLIRAYLSEEIDDCGTPLLYRGCMR